MAAIGVKVQHCDELKKYLRTSKDNMIIKGVANYMTREVSLQKDKEGEYIYIITEFLLPSFKQFALYLLVFSGLVALVFGLWVFILGIIGASFLMLQELVRTRRFNFWALKKGLSKANYFGELELMTEEEVFRRNIKEWRY